MINNTIDFDYSISKILKGTNTNIYLQSDILNSDYINNSFKEIENTLNTLYEKTRYLEDSIAYTKEFLETRINDFSIQMDSILHEIENISDSSKNLSYVSYNVPFVKNTEVLTDRDGLSEISPLIIKDKNLTLDYRINELKEFSTCNRISDTIPYHNNLNKIKEEPYRAIYLEERLAPEGCTESIIVYFNEPTIMNTLDVKLVNCKMTNLRYGLVNGVEEFVGDYSLDLPIVNRVCLYIRFDLVCTNYDLITYEVDKTKITDNIWSKLQNFEYNSIANLENKFDASAIISKTSINSQTGKKNYIVYNTATKTSSMTMYSYVYGIDQFNVRNVDYTMDGYMISDPITIGHLVEGEYIRLNVNHNKQETAEISYSIMDGDVEVPIAIMEEGLIQNELIFNNVDTRFSMDYDAGQGFTPETIYQNGMLIESSYIDAKEKALDKTNRYSVTYTPSTNFYEYKPLNDTIRVKCYIRRYGKNKYIPYISGISIRKYGEDSLWINRY